MAADRKIKTAIQVVPQKYLTSSSVEGTLENVDLDRAAYNRWKLDSDVNKTFGANSIVNNTVSQDWDGWTSMEHPTMTWEMHDGNDTDTDGQWDSATSGEGIYWNGTLLVSSSAVPISNQTEFYKYCYIKNIGDGDLTVRIENSGYLRYKISSGAALAMRGDGGDGKDVQANEIWLQRYASTDTYVEFVIAI